MAKSRNCDGQRLRYADHEQSSRLFWRNWEIDYEIKIIPHTENRMSF